MPGAFRAPCGSSDIWMSRAICSSCSRRRFSSCSTSRCLMRPVMSLNDVARWPSWSSDRTAMRCSKLPLLTRSVPLNSSSTEVVIVRASARPLPSATISMTSKSKPIPISTKSKVRLKFRFASPFRFPPSQLYSVGTSTLMAIRVCSGAPLSNPHTSGTSRC